MIIDPAKNSQMHSHDGHSNDKISRGRFSSEEKFTSKPPLCLFIFDAQMDVRRAESSLYHFAMKMRRQNTTRKETFVFVWALSLLLDIRKKRRDLADGEGKLTAVKCFKNQMREMRRKLIFVLLHN